MKDPLRVTSLTSLWKRFRRSVSRSEWAIRLLGMPRSDVPPTERGLIIVQIDGLSQTQLEYAIEQGNMPFVKSLLTDEHYHLHTFYSGLPSSTPAVQAELFYGKRCVVPAFGFRDHRNGRLVRMFASEIAEEVQKELEKSDDGLLKQGSSYCNIYDGGAKEVHFCATSFGWSEFFATVNPFRILVVLLLQSLVFFRVLGLMIVEFFLATIGCIKGVTSGRQFWQELIMIPARVVVVVLLRELVTMGASYDAARGLPVIYLNLLGYDEQAHRRGPGSKFAHWTLRGIDHSVRRLWKSAHRSARREYDFWVLSDHGQETTRPYQMSSGRPIQQVVAEIVDGFDEAASSSENKPGRLPSRANWLGIGWLVSMLFGEQDVDIQTRSTSVQTVTSGPLAFVYFLNSQLVHRREEIANQLVHDKNVPMAVLAEPNHRATVVTQEGTFQLPADAVQVFGPSHPFLDEVSNDFIALCHHPDAGDILLAGWTHRIQSTAFVLQNGAHAGPGIEETRAFALLPRDVHIIESTRRYLRPDDLRRTALRFLERDATNDSFCARWVPPDRQLRVLTYNVHACVGMDGQLSPARISRVISQSGANVICLQELDVFRKRSGNRDQAHDIAQHLEMSFQFHPAWHLEEERFGNAVLTRFPMRVVKAQGLHHFKESRSKRGAIWVEVDIDSETRVQVLTTHLSIYPKEQLLQAEELIEEWVQPALEVGPVVLCGDFNARPSSAAYKLLCKYLDDAQAYDDVNKTSPTYFSPKPFMRVDHIFTSGLDLKHCQVIGSRLAQQASDHLPLVAQLALKPDSLRRTGDGAADGAADGTDRIADSSSPDSSPKKTSSTKSSLGGPAEG